MGWVAEAFRENTNLEHQESMRMFLFVLTFVSALVYIYILGYLAAGGVFDTMVWLFLFIGVLFDLLPEVMTLHSLDLLPDTARRVEMTQLGMTMFAYVLLAITLFGGTALPTFLGYVSFAVLWILAFLIQNTVLFHLE